MRPANYPEAVTRWHVCLEVPDELRNLVGLTSVCLAVHIRPTHESDAEHSVHLHIDTSLFGANNTLVVTSES